MNNTQKPLDPTRSREDLIGDTTGMTGVTTGNAQQTSATPNDIPKDQNKDHLPGGILPDNIESNASDIIPEEAVNDVEYKKNMLKDMSDVMVAAAEDIATEEDVQDTAQKLLKEDKSPRISANASFSDLRDPHRPASSEEINRDAIGVNVKDAAGDDSPGSDEANTETAPYQQDYNLGEQSVSGTTPDPTSDDDTLANAHAMGMQ